MDIGVFGCPKEIGTKNYSVTTNPFREAYSNKSNYQDGVGLTEFTKYGSWTTFD